MTDAPFHWDRFWFPAGNHVSLIDGYLPDPEGWMGPHLDARGVRLHALADIPCLILLGVPGMGKTSEMNTAATAARQTGELVDFISLARLASPTELHSQLVGSAHHKAWQQGTKVWNIYLDGLDEALAQLSQIEKAIPDLVVKLAQGSGQLTNLRLRISCRSAEWPQPFEAELRGVWDTEQVKVYELGHLREKDVKLAVAQLFPSASKHDRFLAYVREHEAQPLASRPITLNMLLNVFRQEAILPKQQVQLYRKGLLASIEEANETRRLDRQTWRLDTRSKLMVAARIAACTIFSNSPEIWTGHQSQVPPARATVLSEIAGGYEPTLGSSFLVGEAELREALLTSLFVPHRSELFGWAHQTFAEFLTAYYLVEHGLTAEEVLDFLRGPDNAEGQIPPQLTEVAAWLASMQPDFFRTLIRTEPAILLRSDVSAAAPEDRAALVAALLQRIDDEELHDFERDFRFRYDRLNHPRLGEQLSPYISLKTKNPVVRRVAIDVAEANKLVALDELLCDVTLDITDNIHIRSQAGHAVASLPDTNAKSRLKTLVQNDQLDDIYDDLKGYALRSLWPDRLSVSELLTALTPPKNNSYFGGYAFFLHDLQLPQLSVTDAVSALQWCADVSRRDHKNTAFDRVVPRFLARVFEASNSALVREPFADFLQGLVRDGAYWSYSDEFHKSLSDTVLTDSHEGLRRELILSILGRATTGNERDYVVLLGGSHPLVAGHDLGWLVELLGSELSSEIKRQLVTVIVNQTFSQKLDDISFVWDAAANSTELSGALERAYSSDLSSATAKWQRDDLERKKKQATEGREEPIDAVARIERDLAKIEANGSFEWWRLNLLLFARPDGRLDPLSEFQSDITKSHGWALLSENQRSRVVSSAQRYLTENFVRSAPWLGTQTFHRPAAAGYRAFRLLLSEDQVRLSQLDSRVWRKWATSIIGVNFNEEDLHDREIRERIIRRCYELAPAQVLRIVQRLISTAKSEFDVRNVLRSFSSTAYESLNNLLWRALDQSAERGTRAKAIIQFLIQQNYAPAVELTISLLGQPASAFNEQITGASEFVTAAAALLQRDAKAVWPHFSTLLDRDERLATEVLNSISSDFASGDAAFVHDLSEAQLSDFYVWLYRHIPTPTEHEGARDLGFGDHIERLRNIILLNLIGRGTPASVVAVQYIATKLPEAGWIKWRVVDARREVAAKGWKRLDPPEVIALIAAYRPMPEVRSTKEAIKAAATALQDVIEAPSAAELAVSVEAALETVSLPLRTPTKVTVVKPRRIMAVATEWTSGHGGLSTLNRELCIALAAAGHDVACLVPDPNQREIDEARLAKVRLIGCPRDPDPNVNRLLLFHPSQLPDYAPEIVIGHDHITGSAAQHIAERHYGVPNAHFIHTLPEEIEIFKSRADNTFLRGAEKASVQYQQCMKAQLIVCVGPRIHREMSTKIAPNSTVPVAVMRPGLDRKLLKYDVDLAKPRSPHCLFLARLEDGELKGAGLACQAIFSLNSARHRQLIARPRLIMRGFDPDPKRLEEEIARIGGFKDAIPYLIFRPYTADAEEIASDIRSASSMIMPSKREGFGLTALEGMAAGIPVLISAESGLAELLFEHDITAAIGQSVAEACIADVDGSAEAVVDDWAARIQATFFNPAQAFAQAKQIRAALAPVLSWENAAEQFSLAIEQIL